MTGIVGGTASGTELDRLATALYQEDWYETQRIEDRSVGAALVEHGTRDERANYCWQDDGLLGVVYGAISNWRTLSITPETLFTGLRDTPGELLPKLDGPFAIACIDSRTRECHLATDKAGSRPLYHTKTDDGFYFGTELSPLLGRRPGADLAVEAIRDLLFLGYVTGERTLVEGIRNLPPATHLVYRNGAVSTERYWWPTSDGLPVEGYPQRWLDDYRTAMTDLSATVDDISLWLSGGLDSRVAAGTLDAVGQPFDAMTYAEDEEAGPARSVADALDVAHRRIEAGPDGLVDAIEQAVATTDSMIQWSAFACLPFMFDGLHAAADVVMEGGTFMGEDLWQSHIRAADEPLDAVLERKRSLPESRVRDLLTDPVDPADGLRSEIAASVDGSTERTALDAVRRLYSYSHMRSNVPQRSQVGTRTVAHGSMLEDAVRMPMAYRMGALPLSGGRVPAGVPKIKLAVIRELNDGLDEVPYDRTGLAPRRSYPLHVLGFGVRSLRSVLGTTSQYARYYRAGTELTTFVDDRLSEVAERPQFDADAVARLREDVREGTLDNFSPLAALSGLECWLQREFDRVARMQPATYS
jgi:asparagine synthase (glutamine-hydrolysing)